MHKSNEYLVDRLTARINELEQEILVEKSTKTDMIAAEIMLAVVCFCAGCAVGAMYL